MKFLDNKRKLNTEDSILSNADPNQNETAGNEGAVVSHPTGNEGFSIEQKLIFRQEVLQKAFEISKLTVLFDRGTLF